MELASERERVKLLLDIDALLTPDDQPDAAAIERLLREGSDNAVIREVRLGRLSTEEAEALLHDAATARSLSPAMRESAEKQIVVRFSDWQQFELRRQAIFQRLDEQQHAVHRLLDEAAQLTESIRAATTASDDRTIRIAAAAQGAATLIPNADLRQSVEALVDAALTNSSTPTSRSQNQ